MEVKDAPYDDGAGVGALPRARGCGGGLRTAGRADHDVYDAFYHEPGIRLITARHEQTAAYMADGYTRSTGKIGAALVVPGPGLLNAAAGIGTAYASSSPVLLLAGQVESYNIGKGAGAVHEVVDQLDVVKNITKWRSTIMEPGEARRPYTRP